MRILTVCTANICRSPAAAALLRRGLADLLPQAVVTSAGIAAEDGRAACDLSAALVGELTSSATGDLGTHASRLLDRQDVEQADLILALDRTHRSAIARLDPASRPQTLTLRQAAAAAEVVAAALREGATPEGAPPMPGDPADRFAWWVAELDAARAFLPTVGNNAVGSLTFDVLDVPDPHVVGYQYHPVAVELIEAAVNVVLDSLRLTLNFSPPGTGLH